MKTFLSASVLVAAVAANAQAAFSTFVIRGTPQILANNVYVPGATEFVIAAGGQKAGWGSNAVNGSTIGSLSQMVITRHDNAGRFTPGSGPSVAPYLNIWISDGVNYAVVANEPSNGSFAAFRTAHPGGGYTYNFSANAIAAEVANIYETTGAATKTDWVHVALNKVGQQLTFADVMGFTIAAPSAAFIAGGNGIGSGAPRELGSNVAMGFNWVFGDTLSNYVSGDEGYVVSGAGVVPTPGSLALLGLGGLAAVRRRRA